MYCRAAWGGMGRSVATRSTESTSMTSGLERSDVQGMCTTSRLTVARQAATVMCRECKLSYFIPFHFTLHFTPLLCFLLNVHPLGPQISSGFWERQFLGIYIQRDELETKVKNMQKKFQIFLKLVEMR